MKNLFGTLWRYIMLTCLIVLIIFCLNIALLIYIGVSSGPSQYHPPITAIVSFLSEKDGSYQLSGEGQDLLRSNHLFAFLLNEGGDIVWEWERPEELPTHYTMADIASLTRWYLMDYPVYVWDTGHGLLVLGSPKNSIWKYPLELPMPIMNNLLAKLPLAVGTNLLLLLVLSLFFGFAFYRSIKPVAGGIERLALQEPVVIPEKGSTRQLRHKLNQTSALLAQQKEKLEQRDNARTNWISGVSHDIRTPLSMIMGYADSLESDPVLPSRQREQAAVIKSQSMRIKKLIEDLNLTCRLEYNMQPLRLSPFSPAALLRELAASFLNDGPDQHWQLDLQISPEVESLTLRGDTQLLTRAFRNLLDNSVQHNQKGCHILVTASLNKGRLILLFADTGKGFPESVLRAFEHPRQTGQASVSSPHIMGLHIVRQIVASHGGTLSLGNDWSANSSSLYRTGVHIELPSNLRLPADISAEISAVSPEPRPVSSSPENRP